ncbi:MAG: restriction endonuclease subunit S, partial [Nitrospirota bacterium]
MQCFVVWSDEIEGRFDPYYLKTIPIVKSIKTSYPLISLSDLLKEPPQYGANEAAVQGDSQTDVRYIRITDIDEYGNLKDNDWKTAKTIENKYLLEGNDILFARTGATAGKTFIYRKDFGKAIFAGYLIRFRFDGKKVDPRYIFYYTQLSRYANWINLIQRPSGQPNINSEEYKAFEIPLPPLKVQHNIVQIMMAAYEQKKQREAEAQGLLDSIDSYVLDELGIKVPVVEDKICFVVDSEDVWHNRLDAYYFQPKFEDVEKALKKGLYEVIEFNRLITDLKNGVEIRNYSDEGYRYLRVTDLGKFGINDSEPRFVAVNEIPERIKLNDNSFLISRSGSLGLVSVVEEKIKDVILSSHIFKVDFEPGKVIPRYLEAFFRSALGQIQFFRNNNGGIVPEINQSALKSLMVVIPPLEIQNKIAK